MVTLIKIGLLGFGTVNSGVYEGMQETISIIEEIIQEKIVISKILVRNKQRYNFEKFGDLLTDIPNEFFQEDFDVVFEAIGGVQPALDYITTLLTKQTSVITANKEVIAKHGDLLEQLAQKNSVFIGFEATVAGGVPVINLLRSQLQWTSVERVSGILNGTTNYLITRLKEEDRTFESVLKEAQQLGFAEADPTADIEGFDALYKLQILSKLCFGMWVKEEQFQRKGMSNLKDWYFKVGEPLNLTLKYIAKAYYDGSHVQGSVSLCFVDKNHPLASVDNENNGIQLKSKWLGSIFISGPGAGKKPTATSMIEDFLHQVQKKNLDLPVIKRNQAIASENKQFLLLYDLKDEREVYQSLKGVRCIIDESIPIDNHVGTLITVKDEEILTDITEKVKIFPVLIDKISEQKKEQIEVEAEMNVR